MNNLIESFLCGIWLLSFLIIEGFFAFGFLLGFAFERLTKVLKKVSKVG